MTAKKTPIDGAALLDALRDTIRRYVILPSPEALDAVGLWIAATHAQTAWAHAPRLVIRAPEKRCGKVPAARHRRGHLPRPADDRQRQPGRGLPLDRGRHPADAAGR